MFDRFAVELKTHARGAEVAEARRAVFEALVGVERVLALDEIHDPERLRVTLARFREFSTLVVRVALVSQFALLVQRADQVFGL